ncbi:MAG: glycosyltransferase [Nevskiaceae bacterium]|nr:MAG: glycosyltransferase [Nevskiaceae bacterium]TBR71824.1 MAG: glycosyltransferase [Nevskiaceae bacterium]
MILVLASAIGWLLLCATAAYSVLVLLAVYTVRGWHARQGAAVGVSILKPLYGAEPRLYENLRSFCDQNYPTFQVVFGVQDTADPALAVARQVKLDFPERDIDIVINSRVHGRNRKVGNLLNILERARHPWLVIADSDIEASRDYLQRVCAPLAHADVGLVTCLYRSRALGGWWTHLGGLFIDEWFVPSVRLSYLFGSRRFGFGATIALRRETLDVIGGFQSIADELADDYRLGERTRRAGLSTVLSDYIVTTDVAETSPRALLARELRWLRTIRMLNPLGYTFAFVSFDAAIAIIGALLAPVTPATRTLLALTLATRAVLHFTVTAGSRGHFVRGLLTLPLVPLRDTLNLILWGMGFARRRVVWAGRNLDFDNKGLFRNDTSEPGHPEAGPTPPEHTTT